MNKYITSNNHIGIKKSFAIVGLGLDAENTLTKHALNRLEIADVIFMIEPFDIAKSIIPSFANKIISLDSKFDNHSNRIFSLQEIANEIHQSCNLYSAPVFALQGHPTFACYPVQLLIDIFRYNNIDFEIIAGLSSPDHFFADLSIDPFSTGFQFILGDQIDKISPKTPVLILSPGYSTTITKVDRLIALSNLCSRLIDIYGIASEFILYSKSDFVTNVSSIHVIDIIDLININYYGNILIAGPKDLIYK